MTRRTGADATGRVEPIDGRSRPRDMTISGALRPAAGGRPSCWGSRPAASEAARRRRRSPRRRRNRRRPRGWCSASSTPAASSAPSVTAGRLPLVSVYADGRVISEGPVAAIYPGPALPNLQVQQIDRGAVQDLVDRALAAGVAETTDLGTPPVADAPRPGSPSSRRGTPTSARCTRSGETPPEDGGLTADQEAARAKLSDLLTVAPGRRRRRHRALRADGRGGLATPWVDPRTASRSRTCRGPDRPCPASPPAGCRTSPA